MSIVIPCWNSAATVRAAIESAIGQTYENIETIVIDDGSTDDSLTEIRSFDGRIRWETGPNRGGGAARNRGIELAAGEYVQFLDADDQLDPEKISRQVEVSADIGDAVSICWGRVVPDDPYLRAQYTRPMDGDDSVVFAVSGILPTCAPLHRRRILLEVDGFDTTLPCAQEWDLHLRMTCHGVRFHQLRQVLFTAHRRPGSVSWDGTRVLLQYRSILARAAGILRRQRQMNDARALAFGTVAARSARQLLRRGQVREGRELLQWAADMHPGAIAASFTGRSRRLFDLVGQRWADRLIGWRDVLRETVRHGH